MLLLLLFPTLIVTHVTHPQRDCGKVERGRSARIYDIVLKRFRVDAQKQCKIRLPQLHRIRIWTESWNLKDYDTHSRRAFMYQLIERKPAMSIGYWIIQKKNAF